MPTRSPSAFGSGSMAPRLGYQNEAVAPTGSTSSDRAPAMIRSKSGVGTRRPIQLKSIVDGSTVQIFRA